MYINLISLRQEVMTIPKILKWREMPWLKREKGGVDEWLDEQGEEGGDEVEYLFQTDFLLLVSLSFFNSIFSTNYVHLDSSKTVYAQLLKLPAESTVEILFPISFVKYSNSDIRLA